MDNQMKKVEIITKNLENAKNIKLSTNTHKLIMCRAMLDDIHETVVDVIGERYENDQDKFLENFRSKILEFDKELCNLISLLIEVTPHDGDYKTGGFKEM